MTNNYFLVKSISPLIVPALIVIMNYCVICIYTSSADTAMFSQLQHSFKKWLVVAGQIELYTHLPVMRQLVEQLQQWEFRVCGVFLVDSQFMVESFKVTVNLCSIFTCLFESLCFLTQLISYLTLFNVVMKASMK